MAVLGLRFCARAFSSCGKRGPLLIAVHGPLTIAASLVASTGSRRTGSAIAAHGPSRSAARGTLPDQGTNPCPLHWQADSQPLRHQGSPVILVLIFWGITKLLSRAAAPFYIPTNSTQGLQFLHILSNTFYFLIFFIVAILIGVLHFPNDGWCSAAFHVLIGHLYVFFGKIIQGFCLFFKYKQQKFISHSPGGWTSEMRMSAC